MGVREFGPEQNDLRRVMDPDQENGSRPVASKTLLRFELVRAI
jgi:hypothetical protein